MTAEDFGGFILSLICVSLFIYFVCKFTCKSLGLHSFLVLFWHRLTKRCQKNWWQKTFWPSGVVGQKKFGDGRGADNWNFLTATNFRHPKLVLESSSLEDLHFYVRYCNVI